MLYVAEVRRVRVVRANARAIRMIVVVAVWRMEQMRIAVHAGITVRRKG